MSILSWFRVRTRLLIGFSVSVAMVVLCAVAGGWALWRLGHTLASTTVEVGGQIVSQGALNQELAAIRELARQIQSTDDPAMLGRAAEEAGRLRTDNARIRATIETIRTQLVPQRAEWIESQRAYATHAGESERVRQAWELANQQMAARLLELVGRQKKADEALAAIVKNSASLVDSVQFDATIAQEKATADIHAALKWKTGDDTNAQATSATLLVALTSSADRTITLIRNAMAVQIYALELDTSIKGALIATDPALVQYSRNVIGTFRDQAQKTLDGLPANDDTRAIKAALAQFDDLTEPILAAKTEMLAAASAAHDMETKMAEANRAATAAAAKARAAEQAFGQAATAAGRALDELDRLAVSEVGAVKSHADTQLNRTQTAIRRWQMTLILIGMAAFVLAGLVGTVIARSITAPIQRVIAFSTRLGQGDLTARLDANDHSRDELGQLAGAMNRMAANFLGIVRNLTAAVQELTAAAQDMIGTSTTLAAGAEQMRNQSQTAAVTGEQLSANATAIAAGAEQMSAAATSVAASIEEMSIGIRDVAKHCEKEMTIARQADDEARHAQTIMGKLGEAAIRINGVVEVIRNIADQTNLLALNATIEAASAGDAGKGFAVVANEVKVLAKQSAQATDKIAQQIEDMQTSTQAAIQAIGHISTIVSEVTTISGSIAASIDQQSVATKTIAYTTANVSAASGEMARNVHEAAQGATSVAQTVVGIDQAAGQVAESAARTRNSASALSKMAATLKTTIGQFKV